MPSETSVSDSGSTYPRGFSEDVQWLWPLVPARKIIQLNYGKALKAEARVFGEIPVYGTNGQCGWHDVSLARGPGLILGRKGQGPLGVEWCAQDFWVIDTAYYATPLTSEVRLKYIYHLIRYIGLNHLKDGTSNPSLSRDVFGRQLLPLPNLSEQDCIIEFLGALDDRIDLLRQTNATLESIAQALFKSWFIDFDPVRSKAEGREPEGMDAATAALFPAEFEDSALGGIPKGWRAGTLQTICTNPRAQAKPGQMPSDTPYIGLEHMPRKSIALSDAGTAEGLESGKFWFERNDVLFGKLRPYFHKVGLAPGRGVCSTDILVLRPTSAEWLGFLAMHASSDALITHTTQLSNGARMPRTSWQDVGGFDVALPLPSIAAAFDGLVRPMFERIHANIDAARVLASLRDTLLPRLISGKLRLPEAQEQLADALA